MKLLQVRRLAMVVTAVLLAAVLTIGYLAWRGEREQTFQCMVHGVPCEVCQETPSHPACTTI